MAFIFPNIRAKVKYTRCRISECTRVLIERHEEGIAMYDIAYVESIQDGKLLRWFDYMCYRYQWKDNAGCFEKIKYKTENIGFRYLYEKNKNGLTSRAADRNLRKYGENKLFVEVPSYFKLLYTEIFHPFYIFQLASVGIWIWDDYYIYAGCIFFMSIASAIVSMIQTRRNRVQLANLCNQTCNVTVFRDGEYIEDMDSTLVAHGDIIEIFPSTQLSCDVLLFQGSCVVNESSLTGESIPISKTPIPSLEEDLFRREVHEKHILFSGTSVLQVKTSGDKKVLGMVIGTGFATNKGDLIRSIMFPKPTKFKFYRDSMKFVLVMGGISMFGCLYTIIRFSLWNAPPASIAKRALDLITIAVPPALPIAMTIGTAFAITRLKGDGIYCISPQVVNVAGRIDVMCFDKTGTLTEDHLDIHGVRTVRNKKLRFSKALIEDLSFADPPLLYAFASCHSLTTLDGELIGDPLEIKMYEATQWKISEKGETTSVISPDKKKEIAILKQFEFTSLLQRMSVITAMKIHEKGHNAHVGDNYKDLVIYSKGAPEKIRTLCNPKTIPNDFDETLTHYTLQGMRVIAVACKFLPSAQVSSVVSMKRSEAEAGLTFLALLVLENNLKEDTAAAILDLRGGNLEGIMVTGDNEYTAINIARKSNIIPNDDNVKVFLMKYSESKGVHYQFVQNYTDTEMLTVRMDGKDEEENDCTDMEWENPNHVLSVNGRAFDTVRLFDRTLYIKMLKKGRIYSRMSPLDKTQLIKDLQTELDMCVGMCGDGANDLGALKQADVGLSLSDAEASAAAPFTSKKPSITSVVSLLREGRCALSTSIQCYKFMACYSMIQLVTSLLLYSVSYQTKIGDYQFIWIDVIITFPISFLMGRTKPKTQLNQRRPVGSLVSRSIIGSMMLQVLIHTIFSLGFFLWANILYFPRYQPYWNKAEQRKYLITTIFLLTNFQYVFSAIAYSIGKPYRKPVWTNYPYYLSLLLLLFFNCYFVLLPPAWIADILDIYFISTETRMLVLLVVLVNFIICWLVERFIIVSWIQKRDECESPKFSAYKDELSYSG